MKSIEYNLDLAGAMLEQLGVYLDSKVLFWPMGRRHPPGEAAYPMVSTGGLLLVLDELAAAESEMRGHQRRRQGELVARFEAAQQERRVAIETKAAAEANSRLNLWRAYLQDLEHSEAGEWSYRNDVRQRVMLARLMDLLGGDPDLPELRSSLSRLDRRLRARFSAGDFVWDKRLRRVYPQEPYWYLYGKPRIRA